MTEFVLKILLFYLRNEEIQQTMERENSKKYTYVILNFPALDFLIHKIKEWEFQKKFCRSLSNFYTYPD